MIDAARILHALNIGQIAGAIGTRALDAHNLAREGRGHIRLALRISAVEVLNPKVIIRVRHTNGCAGIVVQHDAASIIAGMGEDLPPQSLGAQVVFVDGLPVAAIARRHIGDISLAGQAHEPHALCVRGG